MERGTRSHQTLSIIRMADKAQGEGLNDKIILWVRHFPNLTLQERAATQVRMKEEEGGEAEH